MIALAGTGTGAARGLNHPKPLPESFCTPVISGRQGAQVLIVSDLPVSSFPFPQSTLRMQAAIRYVLALHGFRAGKLTVGYQACDDSSPQQQSGDLSRCAANAKAYAANASVIGAIGTWSSNCAAVEIPILGRARGGAIGLVSPSNTNVGLTRKAPGNAPGEPGRYYPGGTRNFLRLVSPDDAQGRADALLASRLRVRSIFVLEDGSGYGLDVAEAFRSAASVLGLRTAGTRAWNPAATRFTTLARRVSASGADGVFVAGGFSSSARALITQLRAALGRKAVFIAPDAFAPTGETARAVGQSAENLYISIPGTTPARMSPLGAKIARRFGAYRLGSGGPAYAAEAAEVLLNAIARSDGTRAAVTRQLFATNIRNGILGTFRFDQDGDTTLDPVLIFRIRHGRGVLDRVLDAPPAPPSR
jgi:branched-chain amino acid transport system substrate-binding protein